MRKQFDFRPRSSYLKLGILVFSFAVQFIVFSVGAIEGFGQNGRSMTAPAPSPTPVSLKDLVKNDPRTQFEIFRDVYKRGEYKKIATQLTDLSLCPTEWSSTGDELTDSIANLAISDVNLRTTLSSLRFPRTLWDKTIHEFFSKQLADIIRNGSETDKISDREIAFRQQLVRTLNRYRANKDKRLPKLRFEGCGGDIDDTSIAITLAPSDGTVSLIPIFFYKVCQRKQIDPDNTHLCPGWIERTPDIPFGVSGMYFYRATWSDGFVKQGTLQFDDRNRGNVVKIARN